MITGHSHLVKGTRVYGLLNCQFGMHTGEIERWNHLGFRHSLSFSGPNGAYHSASDFANPAFAACLPPDFGPRDLQAAEEWLADTVARLDSVVAEFGFPGLRRPESGIAKLCSSHGVVHFEAETGEVLSVEADGTGSTELTEDDRPVSVDVGEWRARYPGEAVLSEHDILDFGYWYLRDGVLLYSEPCESWRLERGQLRREEREQVLREETAAANPA